MHTFPAFKSDLLQVALEQSFNAVMITNAERGGGGPVIVYCNAALCAMTGYSEAELLGRPRMLQGPATDRAVLDRLRHCLEQGLFFEGPLSTTARTARPTIWSGTSRRYAMGPERSAILSRYSAMSRSGCRRTKSAICWRRP
jgi:PAS domain-containing protein